VAPREVLFLDAAGEARGPGIRFDNQLQGLELGDAVPDALHATVVSPLVETQAWARRAHQRGVASVDCELYHLVEVCRALDPPPRLTALLSITDFPRTSDHGVRPPGGIDLENSPEQQAAVHGVLEALVAGLSAGSAAPPRIRRR
jgi:hypothetical protein